MERRTKEEGGGIRVGGGFGGRGKVTECVSVVVAVAAIFLYKVVLAAVATTRCCHCRRYSAFASSFFFVLTYQVLSLFFRFHSQIFAQISLVRIRFFFYVFTFCAFVVALDVFVSSFLSITPAFVSGLGSVLVSLC